MNPPPTAPVVLVVATRNRKKGEELAQLLDPPWEPSPGPMRLDVRTPRRLSPPCPRPSRMLTPSPANARKKASEAALALGLWVLADDSGLAVDALDGAPGIYSARYAGKHGDDDANNRKLLEALADVPDNRRGAAFVCARSRSPIPRAKSAWKARRPVGAGSPTPYGDRAGYRV